MLIEKADMLDALIDNFAGMDLPDDATDYNVVMLSYVIGWLDAIGSMVDADKKKQGKMEGEGGE